MRTGEVDMWTFVPSAYAAQVMSLPNVARFRGPSYLYGHITFNTQHPALKEKVVRQALRLATDRKLLRDKISHGIGILQESSITPASPFHTDVPMVPYDSAQANAMLDAAGWKRGPSGIRAKNGVALNLELGSVSGSQDADARIEQLRSMWRQIGVGLTVKHYSSALFFQVTGGIVYGGKFDVVAFSWQLTPDADLNPENSCTLFPPNGQNVSRFCDPKLQTLLEQQKLTYDEGKRKAIIAEEEPIIADDVPYFVTAIGEDIHAYNKDLTGWKPNNTTPFDDFMSVDI
jgi:peptide/nickel transport system substrate-binding protein